MVGAREVSAGDDDGSGVAVEPAQRERVFVGAGAEDVAVDGLEEGRSFFVGEGTAGFVEGVVDLEPGDGVVGSCDEAVEAGDGVEGDHWAVFSR